MCRKNSEEFLQIWTYHEDIERSGWPKSNATKKKHQNYNKAIDGTRGCAQIKWRGCNSLTHRQSRVDTPMCAVRSPRRLIVSKSQSLRQVERYKSFSILCTSLWLISFAVFPKYIYILHIYIDLDRLEESIVVCCFRIEFKFRFLDSFHSQFLINHSHGYSGRRER